MSPSNPYDDVLTKTHEYLAAGVGEVWIISLSVRNVTIYNDPDSPRVISLAKNGVLKGPQPLEDFSLPLEDLFAELPTLTDGD